MYKISYKDILYNTGDIARIFIITKWKITSKNCESLYCTIVTHIILYINNNKINKKRKKKKIN